MINFQQNKHLQSNTFIHHKQLMHDMHHHGCKAPTKDDVDQLSQVKVNVLYLNKTVQKLL